MTAYGQGYSRSPSQVVLEAKEKRKQVLEAVRKRRVIIYQQFREKLRMQGGMRVSGMD